MNAHANGIPVDTFYNQTELVKSFRVISTNYDRNGTNFISTFEGMKLVFVLRGESNIDHGYFGGGGGGSTYGR